MSINAVILPHPATLTPIQRAAELSKILATAIHRTHLATQSKNLNEQRQLQLGYSPTVRVHTTPNTQEETTR
ncbi:conserved hypothetical protein [Gammaproteobacteria bacterium]